MIKDLLVNLSIGAKDDAAAAFASPSRPTFDAHASGVAFAYEPVIPATVMGGMMPVDFIEAQRAENEQAAGGQRRVRQAATRAGVVGRDPRVLVDRCGRRRPVRPHGAALRSRVVAQADPDTAPAEDMIAEAALFQSGRPVIVVPYIHKGGLKLDRMMVCWDGGRTAARAIGDAMPLLERAKQVDVVIVTGEEGKRDTSPRRRHGPASGAPRPQGRGQAHRRRDGDVQTRCCPMRPTAPPT